MIKVQEDVNKGLRRALTITVPHEEVEAALSARLQEIAKKAKIQGFRPGKAPIDLIRQRFGAEARGEVYDRLISQNAEKAMTERSLRPAAQPTVDDVVAEEGKDLSFKMSLEVLPAVTPMDFAKLKFERAVASVEAAAIDDAIIRIAKTMREPETVSPPRAAAMGDVAVIDFDGTVDGVAHDGMKSADHKLELGTKSFIDGFEDQIVGMKTGEKKDIRVTFPKDYHAAHLAGKKAVFAVTLKDVRAHKPVTMDDALGKEIGFPSMEKLRERIAADLGKRYEHVSRTVLKRTLMDALAKHHAFDLPEVMVETEFSAIWAEVQKDKAAGRLDADDAKKSEDALKADYRAIAERRVRLGLLLAHVAEENKIEVQPAELREALMAEARRYPGQEQQVIEYLTKTRGALERLRAPILEDKVVDFILAKASITDKTLSAEALLALPEEMETI